MKITKISYIVIAVFVSLALLVGIAAISLTYSEVVCVAREKQPLVEDFAGDCKEQRTVRIIKGTEDYIIDHENRCKKFFAEPAYDYTGGHSGSEFKGCEIF